MSGLGADFLVEAGQLRSNGPASTSTIYLTTAGITSVTGNLLVWEFYVNYDNAPSASNNIEIFLMSDRADLSDSPIGYYIRLGESNSDDGIDLFKTSSGSPLIADAAPSVAAGINTRIRVTRDPAGLWSLEADNTGGTNFTLVGTVTDTEFLDGSYVGFKVEHTSTRAMDFYFDDVSLAITNMDTAPPQVIQVEVVSENQLLITFDEPVEPSSATTNVNYDLDQSYGAPQQVTLTQSDQAQLTFASALVTNDYELTIKNISDFNNNVIDQLTIPFSYTRTEQGAFRDVIITEVMADPTPPLGLPESDFIELYNRSAKAIDLEGWTLADANSAVLLESHVLLPGEYVILSSLAYQSEFSAFGEALGVAGFPNFNVAGDDVILRSSEGILIDQVIYDDAWYGSNTIEGGVSLELIDTENLCGTEENWSASINPDGGTPGGINSINQTGSDVSSPELISARPITPTSLSIEFSEPVDSLSLDVASIVFTPALSVVGIRTAGNMADVITSGFTPGTPYSVQLTDVRDCVANSSDALSASFTYIENPPLFYRDVIITEIMANPNDETPLPNAEYIELYNTTDQPLNLSGFSLRDGSTEGTLPYYLLAPSSYVLITDVENSELFSTIDNRVPIELPTLNNSGDQLALSNAAGVLLDSVVYSTSWYRSSVKDDGGYSLEIIDPSKICSDEDNWAATENPSGGTPGVQNSIFSEMPDNRGPVLLEAIGVASDSVMLYFDENLDESSVYTADYSFSGGLAISQIILLDARTVILKLSSRLTGNTAYTVTISGVKDCPGNLINDSEAITFYLIEEAGAGDVLINEVLFNPRTGGSDYVEIYNASNKYLNLKGWSIANGEIVNDMVEVRTVRQLSANNLISAPKEFLVITDDITDVMNTFPQAPEQALTEVSSLPSFPDDAGLIVISSPMQIIDYFSYSEDYHSQVISDAEGVALERITISLSTNDPQNWTSAASSVNYGTPGYKNSQSREAGVASGMLSISPKVIEPDGDGLADFALLRLAFDTPGNVININLYDALGRHVRTLVSNDLAGVASFHGSLASDTPLTSGTVKTRILVANGGADPMVPASQVSDFVNEMVAAGVEFRLLNFPDAKHSFTNPGATAVGKQFDMPLEYNQHADEQSWQALLAFMQE